MKRISNSVKGAGRLLREESGSQTLEYVALMPLMLLAMLMLFQIAMFGYTLVVGEASVRESALVASRDQQLIAEWPTKGKLSPITMTAQATAGGVMVDVDQVSCDAGQVTVKVQTTVPNVFFDSPAKFPLQATMPTQDGACP